MSEKDRLLSGPSANAYYREQEEQSQLQRAVGIVSKLDDWVIHLWTKFVLLIHAREFFAELLATFILVTFGNGAVAQSILSDNQFGTFLTINIGYAIGVMIGAYVAIGVTGGHMNPAVTFAMALRGKTSWVKVIPYWIAQFLGAFLSSAVVYGVYVDAINDDTPIGKYCYEVNGTSNVTSNVTGQLSKKLPRCTGGIFATYPADHLTLGIGFVDQVVGTFLLVLGIFAICDSQNSEPKAGMKPLLIGFLLWGVGTGFGFNCGYAVNPARDFAPRVFTAMAGWGSDVFRCSQCKHISHWWWVPLVAPMVGASIATIVYWGLIEAHHLPNINPKDDGGRISPIIPSSVNEPEKLEPDIRQRNPHNY